MSEVKVRFDEFLKNFRSTQMWRDMVNTREDSPWHREENVSVHTLMLLDWYQDNLFNSRTENQRMLTMVGCLMHDIGKPPAQIIKSSPERGEYRAYHGHEQLSARMWVSYAAENMEMITTVLRFSADDVSNIALMLEHHVPFGLKDKVKRKNLKTAFISRMGESGHQAWLDMLMSDQHGRISDGQAEKLAAVDEWMEAWKKV
jgi:hypothetical protein